MKGARVRKGHLQEVPTPVLCRPHPALSQSGHYGPISQMGQSNHCQQLTDVSTCMCLAPAHNPSSPSPPPERYMLLKCPSLKGRQRRGWLRHFLHHVACDGVEAQSWTWCRQPQARPTPFSECYPPEKTVCIPSHSSVLHPQNQALLYSNWLGSWICPALKPGLTSSPVIALKDGPATKSWPLRCEEGKPAGRGNVFRKYFSSLPHSLYPQLKCCSVRCNVWSSGSHLATMS